MAKQIIFWLFCFCCFAFSYADTVIGGQIKLGKKQIEAEKQNYSGLGLSEDDIKARIIERMSMVFAIKKLNLMNFDPTELNRIRKRAEEDSKNGVYTKKYLEEEMILSIYVKTFLDGMKISQEEILARQKEYEERNHEGMYYISEIFLNVPKNSTVNQEYEVLQRLNKIKSSSSDVFKFSQNAAKFSQRLSKYNGGLVGLVVPGALEPVVGMEIKKSAPNSIVGPIKEENGFNLIFVMHFIPPGQIPEDEQIRQEIKSQKLQSHINYILQIVTVSIK